MKNLLVIVWLALVLVACNRNEAFRSLGGPSGRVATQSQAAVLNTFRARFTQQTDILVVLDNSGSMSEERQAVRDNLNSFHRILNSRRLNDYQLAVVTVDAFFNEGVLSSFNGIDLVNSSTPDPVATVAGILNGITQTSTAFWEQGLKASELAIRRYQSRLLRDGVELAVIYLSDEEDYSCIGATNGAVGKDCPGLTTEAKEPQNIPDPKPWTAVPVKNYSDFFKSLKRSVLLYPIVGMPSVACDEASKGMRYLALLADLPGGMAFPLCTADIPVSFLSIANAISSRGDCYHLNEPVADSLAMGVVVDNAEIARDATNGFSWDESTNSVCFKGHYIPPANSLIQVSYTTSVIAE